MVVLFLWFSLFVMLIALLFWYDCFGFGFSCWLVFVGFCCVCFLLVFVVFVCVGLIGGCVCGFWLDWILMVWFCFLLRFVWLGLFGVDGF